jgi:Ca2+-binding RTX toxin-like protein
MLGGGGNDQMTGALGDDTLNGGTGNDALNGDEGNDSMLGAAGLDTLVGGTGDDTLRGGAQDDVLEGEEQQDSLFGDAGKDTLRGGDGNDVLNGGTDNDTLVGGEQDDTMTGGAGADRFYFDVSLGAGPNGTTDWSYMDSLPLTSTDYILDPELIDILHFNVDNAAITSAALLDPFVKVVDNGTDVTIWFDRDGDESWTGDAEDSIVLRGMGIAPGASGIDSLVELKGSINIEVHYMP